jgi:DNA-nicking Smr family endonuclease
MARRTKSERSNATQPKAANKTPDAFFRPFATIAGSAKPKPAVKAPPPPEPVRAPTPAVAPSSDAESFAIFMAGVKALDGRATRIPASASRVERAPKASTPTEDPDAPARSSLRSLVLDGLRFEVSDDGKSLDGRRTDVDPREIRRLRRGERAVDGRLDLHGLSVHDAREAIEAFVRKRHAEGDRVLEIVHGKGSHSPRGVAVLRGELAAWLSQGRSASHVAAFASSDATFDPEQGAGSLLVLLAR